MSKQESISKLRQFQSSEIFWIVFLTIFFSVGLVGISLPQYRDFMVTLSPFHLLLTYFVLFISRKDKRDQFIYFSFLIFVIGILVEAIGTNTGLLFGSYKYGQTLGLKMFGVPLIIGVNWVTMVVCSSTLVNKLPLKFVYKVLLAGFVMTSLDFLIEPVAVKLDYWSWSNSEIPLYNYLCWFVISLPMHYFYMKWKLVENNRVPVGVFVLILFFFLILNFV